MQVGVGEVVRQYTTALRVDLHTPARVEAACLAETHAKASNPCKELAVCVG